MNNSTRKGDQLNFLTWALLLLLSSCSAFIEPSISGSTTTLEAPANQYQSTSYTLSFWWDNVPNALSYHLQVVTPSFAVPANLVLDTVVKGDKFSFNFNPGNYQWRVMAQNGSSQTPYSAVRNFTVVQSSIKQQTVQLTAPANAALTNQSPITFSWGSMYGATGYRLEIDTNNFVDESAVVYNQLIPGQQATFSFPKDHVYQWRVRGENDTAQSQWSAINTITYAHTPPAQVTLTAPSNGQTLSLPVTLQWSSSANAVRYKLYVYQSDGVTLYSSAYPLALTTTSYNFNSGNSGDRVYWTVTAVDAAGNESQAAALQSFVLQ